MEFETTFARIEKMREALRHDFGPDAESSIAEIDRDLELQMQKDPLLCHAADLFYKASIKLRQQRIDTARRLQSNGVEENRHALELLLWDSRLIDFFVTHLRPGEKLLAVTGFTLTTNMQVHTRAQIKTACRMTVEMNPAQFERSFVSDAQVREAEARQNQRENPIAPGSRGNVFNSDWPR